MRHGMPLLLNFSSRTSFVARLAHLTNRARKKTIETHLFFRLPKQLLRMSLVHCRRDAVPLCRAFVMVQLIELDKYLVRTSTVKILKQTKDKLVQVAQNITLLQRQNEAATD